MPGEERVNLGKVYLSIGAGIAVSVAAAFAVMAVHSSYQRDTDQSQDRQIEEVKTVIREGLSELRSDVKELLRRQK